MENVAYSIAHNPEHITEIVVHVDEELGESRRSDLIDALEGKDGIKSVEFCPLRHHLMLVNYNRNTLNSRDVVIGIKSQNIHAQLIGPV
jgi:hypothetical protein